MAGLAANGELNNYARWWAKQMADSGNFSHSDIASLLDPWSTVGENIGYGPSVTSVFNALVASSGHYQNMVDPRFTSVGVGAYVDSTGRIWTAHIFGG
ncbi:MAG TPA: CAP domain-containing protein [Acidimicrobiia bacterium]|nr:CAP domain-containing protein [Acidimicrobiia bacterium]